VVTTGLTEITVPDWPLLQLTVPAQPAAVNKAASPEHTVGELVEITGAVTFTTFTVSVFDIGLLQLPTVQYAV
jgi:hypothetical protein